MTASLSVVVPVFNNAESLREIAARICAAVGADVRVASKERASLRLAEIIFVDDGSTDNSWEVIAELARCDRRIAGIRLPHNLGQGKASLAGLRCVVGEWRALLDADLQDPPESIAYLVAAASPTIDAVFAGRTGEYQSGDRMRTGRIARRVRSALAGVPLDAGAFVVLRARAIDRIAALRVRDVSLVAMIGLAGVSMASVPVPRSHRPHGASSYSAWGRIRAGAAVLRCCAEARWLPATATAWQCLRGEIARAETVGTIPGWERACAS
jgi:glycosyltransferase involved in cell wall biosynthesis